MLIIKLKRYHLEYIDLCINNFLDTTNLRIDLKCKEIRQYDKHIPHKTQRCKGIHLTVEAEIMNNNSVHPVDVK